MIKIDGGTSSLKGEAQVIIAEMSQGLASVARAFLKAGDADDAVAAIAAIIGIAISEEYNNDEGDDEIISIIESGVTWAMCKKLGIDIDSDDDDIDEVEEEVEAGDAVSKLLQNMFGGNVPN